MGVSEQKKKKKKHPNEENIVEQIFNFSYYLLITKNKLLLVPSATAACLFRASHVQCRSVVVGQTQGIK